MTIYLPFLFFVKVNNLISMGIKPHPETESYLERVQALETQVVATTGMTYFCYYLFGTGCERSPYRFAYIMSVY